MFASPNVPRGRRRSGKTGRGTLKTNRSPAGRESNNEKLSNVDSEDTELEENDSSVVVEALSENLSSMAIPGPSGLSPRTTAGEQVSKETRNGPRDPGQFVKAEKAERQKNAKTNTKINAKYKPRGTEDADNNGDSSEGSGWVTMDNVTENCPSPNERKKSNLISTGEAPVQFYTIGHKVIVVMKRDSRFSFTGKLTVKVLYGAVRTYGYTIVAGSDPVEVYSPRGNACDVTIETISELSEKHTPEILTVLNCQEMTACVGSELKADIARIRPGMVVLMLSNLKNHLTEFLKMYFPLTLFPKISYFGYFSYKDIRRAEMTLQANLHFNNSNEQIYDPRLTEITRKITDRWRRKKWTCTMITGGQKVGKSTVSRFLINDLLSVLKMVVLLDIDIGQTECTPPGCISYSLIKQPLTGPNFTHLIRPTYQLYIGNVDVNRCLARYVSGVQMLFWKLSKNEALAGLPIIVNTMGYSKGLGWDITVFLIKTIRPSFVVQITSTCTNKNFVTDLTADTINEQILRPPLSKNVISLNEPCMHELLILPSPTDRKQTGETWKMMPYQKRNLVIISYLSQMIRPVKGSPLADIPFMQRINDTVPFVAPFSSLYFSILNGNVPDQHVVSVMNGAIVALCGLHFTNNRPEKSQDNIITGPHIRVLQKTPLCRCYGFGLVRGVDMEKEELHLNTPLPAFMMKYVNYLVGCIPIPDTLLDLSRQQNAPYTGGNDAVPTSREPRRGYFRRMPQNNG